MFNQVKIKKTTYQITETKKQDGVVFHYLKGGKVLSIMDGGKNGEWTLSGKRHGYPTMTCHLYAVFS